LVPLLVIFIITLLAYFVVANLTFGNNLYNFSTPGRAWVSCLLILVGEFGEFYPMQNAEFWPTQIIFWSFICMCQMILLNMVLAVVFAVYDALTEDNEAHKSDTHDPHRLPWIELLAELMVVRYFVLLVSGLVV
jgi:hypothetical protein